MIQMRHIFSVWNRFSGFAKRQSRANKQLWYKNLHFSKYSGTTFGISVLTRRVAQRKLKPPQKHPCIVLSRQSLVVSSLCRIVAFASPPAYSTQWCSALRGFAAFFGDSALEYLWRKRLPLPCTYLHLAANPSECRRRLWIYDPLRPKSVHPN